MVKAQLKSWCGYEYLGKDYENVRWHKYGVHDGRKVCTDFYHCLFHLISPMVHSVSDNDKSTAVTIPLFIPRYCAYPPALQPPFPLPPQLLLTAHVSTHTSALQHALGQTLLASSISYLIKGSRTSSYLNVSTFTRPPRQMSPTTVGARCTSWL